MLVKWPQNPLTPVLGVFDSFGMWEGEDWIGQFSKVCIRFSDVQYLQ